MLSIRAICNYLQLLLIFFTQAVLLKISSVRKCYAVSFLLELVANDRDISMTAREDMAIIPVIAEPVSASTSN